MQELLAHYTWGLCIISTILKFSPHDVSHCKSKETEIPQGVANRSDSKIELGKPFARQKTQQPKVLNFDNLPISDLLVSSEFKIFIQ